MIVRKKLVQEMEDVSIWSMTSNANATKDSKERDAKSVRHFSIRNNN